MWLRLVKSGNTITSYVKNKDDYDYLQFNNVDVSIFLSLDVKVTMYEYFVNHSHKLSPYLNTYIG